MKTNENGNSAVQGTTAKPTVNNKIKTENRPGIPGKEKNDEPVKDQTPAPDEKATEVKAAEAKASTSATTDHQPANAPQQSEKQELKSEEPKAEIKYIKPVMNLEQTLKAVDALHRRSLQRVNLLTRIKQLEAFEVGLTQENDELEDNPYQGCRLIIKDDKNRDFVTTTPGLIRLVSQFIFNACHEKLAEIEANIVFPNA